MAQTRGKIRFGIFGTSNIAKVFLKSFQFVDCAAVTAIASDSIEKSGEFAKIHNIPRAFGSYSDMACDRDIDAVFIDTPLTHHMEHALLCIENNLPFICEKPFMTSLHDARLVVDAARKKGLFIMDGLWSRFVPAMKAAREIVGSGTLGDICLMTGDFGLRTKFSPEERLYDPKLGGGALFDFGIYPVSLAHYFLGTPSDVKAMGTVGKSRVEENVSITLKYREDKLAVFSASLRASTPLEISLYGSRGVLNIKSPVYAPKKLVLERFAGSFDELPSVMKPLGSLMPKEKAAILASKLALRLPPYANPFRKTLRYPFSGGGYRFEIEEAVRCLKNGLPESEIMPLDDTLAVHETMDLLKRQVGVESKAA
ncbi:MAG: Gfo/Idh/MocA family oxidoreductase [Oligoflexales bacterium]|nr:Gfo/Idh/MocA family oxidoreductase [Oligoflexales bacterium]